MLPTWPWQAPVVFPFYKWQNQHSNILPKVQPQEEVESKCRPESSCPESPSAPLTYYQGSSAAGEDRRHRHKKGRSSWRHRESWWRKWQEMPLKRWDHSCPRKRVKPIWNGDGRKIEGSLASGRANEEEHKILYSLSFHHYDKLKGARDLKRAAVCSSFIQQIFAEWSAYHVPGMGLGPRKCKKNNSRHDYYQPKQ